MKRTPFEAALSEIRIRKSFIANGVCTHKEFVLVLGASSKGSTIILFWCSVLCSAGQRATVQREIELGVRGPE